MTNILTLFTLYILIQPALALPLHGYLEPSQTPLQASASEDNPRYSTLYLVSSHGVVWMALRHHKGKGLLHRGDKVLTINDYPFSLFGWTHMCTDSTYHLVVKRKEGITEPVEFIHLTKAEYQAYR